MAIVSCSVRQSNYCLIIHLLSTIVAANKVWPGTFTLADFMMKHRDRFLQCSILELGAATGCLSIYLTMMLHPHNTSLVTSDIDDGGEVEANVKYNFLRNGLLEPIHVPYTWGTRWPNDIIPSSSFRYIVASDILLYVKAYPQLVQSLVALFDGGTVMEFIMSWQRRIADSIQFFDLMKLSNFICYHHGNCVYSFFRKHHEAEIMHSYGIG